MPRVLLEGNGLTANQQPGGYHLVSGQGWQQQFIVRPAEQVNISLPAGMGRSAPGSWFPGTSAGVVNRFAIGPEPVADLKMTLFMPGIELAVPVRAP